jgi:uncharacterized protein DUF2171
MADPVSWFVIEPGWKAVAADGTEVGTVKETIGDSSTDIFNGLAISTGLLSHPLYVPAEQVDRIEEGRVVLRLDAEQVGQLEPYSEPPAGGRILPE